MIGLKETPDTTTKDDFPSMPTVERKRRKAR